MRVPLVDLQAQYRSIKDEVDAAIRQVIETCAFAGGPFVERFEKAFASFCQCRCAVGVGSGTDALWVTLLSLGIKPGDEVLTVPNTFIATTEAISQCGAMPAFLDVGERTLNMDPECLLRFLRTDCTYSRSVKSLIDKRTNRPVRAVIPVHLFGQPADMDPIMEIARGYGLVVVEDACQAHGARYKGRPAGSMGDAGCFSFYPGKNLGAYGEAGAVVTNDAALAERIRLLRDHGQTRKYHHATVGWNSRMDGLQGAILGVKLKHLHGWNEARRRIARQYSEYLKCLEGVTTPEEAEQCEHVYHIYAIRAPGRDSLLEALLKKGIHCGIHYPVPIHLQKAYEVLGLREGSFPVAERSARELLSLPIFPELTQGQIELVVNELGACLK